MELSRRKFFSFFGTGVAMLVKPDLFIPKTNVITYTKADMATWVEVWASSGGDDWVMHTLASVPNWTLAS